MLVAYAKHYFSLDKFFYISLGHEAFKVTSLALSFQSNIQISHKKHRISYWEAKVSMSLEYV